MWVVYGLKLVDNKIVGKLHECLKMRERVCEI